MSKYELLLILPGTLDEKEVEARANEVLQLVKENSEETELTTMGKNRLAYPIKQIRYGYFYTIVFSATAEKAKLLESKIRLMRDVLRGIISHFNAHLSAQQKSAYAAQSLPEMSEEKASPAVMEERVKALVGDQPAVENKTVESKAARDIEKLDMDSITKKLDDLMQGDVIPGV